ncbi:hypothetical protein [Fibrobacter sp. UWH5]|uniref:hypothetical protein n=2 Tax=Fibrobacter TaxID=832 RepID=UPI00093552D4|nr:hypothetical protein [Fibrobacter sp. UWH5]
MSSDIQHDYFICDKGIWMQIDFFLNTNNNFILSFTVTPDKSARITAEIIAEFSIRKYKIESLLPYAIPQAEPTKRCVFVVVFENFNDALKYMFRLYADNGEFKNKRFCFIFIYSSINSSNVGPWLNYKYSGARFCSDMLFFSIEEIRTQERLQKRLDDLPPYTSINLLNKNGSKVLSKEIISENVIETGFFFENII